jgi:hypothetical protein
MANQARRDQEERTIEVNRKDLITKLKENLTKHRESYKAALAGYKAMALQKLEEGYEQAKIKLDKNLERGKLALSQFDPDDPSGVSDYLTLVEAISISLKVPLDYSKEYEAAIDMAEWDVRDTLELTHAKFQCFVRDQWTWTRDFESINFTYTGRP